MMTLWLIAALPCLPPEIYTPIALAVVGAFGWVAKQFAKRDAQDTARDDREEVRHKEFIDMTNRVIGDLTIAKKEIDNVKPPQA